MFIECKEHGHLYGHLMGKKPKTLEKIERLLDQLPFNDQEKVDWVSEYRDRYQILHDKNIEDTVKRILPSLIFGDKDERRNALKLLELTFVNRDSLGGAGKTIDDYRHNPEPLIDGVNLFRGIALLVRVDARKSRKEWIRTYDTALTGEKLEAVTKKIGLPLTEQQKDDIRAAHNLYAKRRDKEQYITFEDAMLRSHGLTSEDLHSLTLEELQKRRNLPTADNESAKIIKIKKSFNGAQDTLDTINEITGLTAHGAEIQMKNLRYAHGERPFAISVFAAIHFLTYDGVEEIYAAWENQNPSYSPANNKK